jgi:hypothetical protein
MHVLWHVKFCLFVGPLTKNFSSTLAFGTLLSQTPAERKENLCAAQRIKEAESRDAEHSIGHRCGLNMQGKFTMGLISQKEDDAGKEARQMPDAFSCFDDEN